MKNNTKLLQILTIILGFLSVAAFGFIIFVLTRLQPKMIVYEPISDLEDGLLTGVGFGLLIVLAFLMLSLLMIFRFVRHSERLKWFPLVLIIVSVFALLFVFSDIALLSDIHKQYRANLSQPEWVLVYPMIGFQSLVILVLTFLHVSGYFKRKKIDQVAKDINVFLVVQYVGLISGAMGLGMTCLGFFYPQGWTLTVHTVISGLTIIFPYILAVIYWLVTKLQEKDREWWDEKQLRDLGKSALMTLILDTILMITVFVLNYQVLDGVVHMIWLPLYLFATVFMFSLGNLIYSQTT